MTKQDVTRYLAKIGAKGGKVASAHLTKAERIERARRAGQANKGKKRGKKC